jgi:hypothetical protein
VTITVGSVQFNDVLSNQQADEKLDTEAPSLSRKHGDALANTRVQSNLPPTPLLLTDHAPSVATLTVAAALDSTLVTGRHDGSCSPQWPLSSAPRS